MTKKELKAKFVRIAKKLNRTPSMSDCIYYGISRDKVRYHFGNISNLQKMCGYKTYEDRKKDIVYDLLGVKDER